MNHARLATLLQRVRAEASGERALASVRRIAAFHRIQSSPGYAAAAEWLRGELAALGLTPEIEQVPADGRTRYGGALMPQAWECERARAWLLAGGRRDPLCDFETEPLSLIQRSVPARGTFPLVVLDDGSEPEHYAGLEVRGAVVLTSGPVHRVHQLAVVERGAAGLLADGRRLMPPVRTAEHDRDALAYTSFWWSESQPRGWGLVVSPARGARLREQAAQGTALSLDVEIDTRFQDGTFPVVSACIPAAGPAAREREVLVISHLCHPQPGANDNASGAAASLETARTLLAMRARGAWAPSACAVRFLWMPEWNGTLAWLARDSRRAGRILAAINLDMVGEDQAQCGSTLLLEHPPHFLGSFAEPLLAEIRDDAQDWITSFSGPGHYSLTRMAEVPYSGGSDHAILIHPAQGIPCPMLIQWPDRFYHSSYDTPDRCDPASLVLAVRCAATYAGFLASLSKEELPSLIELCSRRALRRVLDGGGGPDPANGVTRERRRGVRALESLGRLGAQPHDLAAAVRRFESATDALPVGGAPPAAGVRDAGAAQAARVPRPDLAAPLDLMRHLMPGFDTLTADERQAWRTLERDLPGGATAIEIAWYACDGVRTLGTIAEAVSIECGVAAPATGSGDAASIERLFELTARLGLSHWASS